MLSGLFNLVIAFKAMKSKNEKVQTLLNDLQFIDSEKYSTLNKLRKMVFKYHPKSEERMMYGGILYYINNEGFCGLFTRKNHISIEFGTGFKMKDPNKLLEGNGKFRRHLKIKSTEELKSKEVEFYIKQAI